MVAVNCPFCNHRLQINPDGEVLRDRCKCGAYYFIEPDFDDYMMEIADLSIPGQRSLPLVREDGTAFNVVFY